MSAAKLKAWVEAARLRTLPLAIATIGTGAFLAAFFHTFSFSVFFLTLFTAFLLQVLSNFANDLGDTQNGADLSGRQGPVRAVQSGLITVKEMKAAVIISGFLTLTSGIFLLYFSFAVLNLRFIFFLLLGLFSIGAAIKYTAGKNPYGYSGFGDLFVFLFFGIIGVLGSFYLQTGFIEPGLVFPAYSVGAFSVAVLNINNLRDIASDEKAGKYTIPVRIGIENGKKYHLFLLISGLCTALAFVFVYYKSPLQFLFLLVTPFLFRNGVGVWRNSGRDLDPLLKQMALSTLLFVFLLGCGLLLSINI